MQLKLKVLSGSHAGKEIPVSADKFLIGRSESCQLRPKSDSVSRRHCILVVKEGRVLLQDLKSRNGTYVNDKRLPSDKAKVLKPGDRLKIGKLEFEVLIEHGLQGAKKPKVTDVVDAAERMAKAGSEDSRMEDVDVDQWLDEADQIDRVRKLADPETRQFRLDQPGGEVSESGTDSGDLSVNEPPSSDGDQGSSDGRKRSEKQAPGKLPEHLKRAMSESSRDAANDALKRFFSGR